MTPDFESGESSLESVAKDAGFVNPDAMVAAAKKSKTRDAYGGRQESRIRDLESKIGEMQATKHEADLGIGENSDETSKLLARRILSMQSTIDSLAMKASSHPDDAELEPYFDKVLTVYPEVMDVKDPMRRMEMSRRLARQLKAEDDSASGGSGTSRDVNVAATHLTGETPSVSHRTSINEEQAYEQYQRERADAKSGVEKKAVDAKFGAQFPHWGI